MWLNISTKKFKIMSLKFLENNIMLWKFLMCLSEPLYVNETGL